MIATAGSEGRTRLIVTGFARRDGDQGKGEANGRKSWAMRSAAEKAAHQAMTLPRQCPLKFALKFVAHDRRVFCYTMRR